MNDEWKLLYLEKDEEELRFAMVDGDSTWLHLLIWST